MDDFFQFNDLIGIPLFKLGLYFLRANIFFYPKKLRKFSAKMSSYILDRKSSSLLHNEVIFYIMGELHRPSFLVGLWVVGQPNATHLIYCNFSSTRWSFAQGKPCRLCYCLRSITFRQNFERCIFRVKFFGVFFTVVLSNTFLKIS